MADTRKTTSIRLPPSLIERIDALATKEMNTRGKIIEKLLLKALKKG